MERQAFADVGSWQQWVFIVLLMVGVIAGNPRMFALPTLVTLLGPGDRRDLGQVRPLPSLRPQGEASRR